MALAHAQRDSGRTAIATSPYQPRLFRRLRITCPVTGVATDTGFELSEVPAVVSGPQLLIDCPECGQDHPWQIDDAVLDR